MIALSTSSVLLWKSIILTIFHVIYNNNLIIIRINKLFIAIFITLNIIIANFPLILIY
jgi:hypothetical protein